jgi:hypothetical protein
MEKAANESHAELCGFSKDPVWLAQIMQNISIFNLRYTRCTHIAPSRRILTLSTCYTHFAYVAHVHSSYTRCTHVMLRTLHSRSVAQAHLCCTGAFSLHRFSHDAQVYSCCSGATMLHKVHSRCTSAIVSHWCNHVVHMHLMLHRCTFVAQVHSRCTGAFTLHRCTYVAQVHLCCTGAFTLHMSNGPVQGSIAQVHSCCTRALTLYTCARVQMCTHFASVC